MITSKIIENISILSKLDLKEDEKQQAKKDMEEMLRFVEKLQEVDTEHTEPMAHVFTMKNVFREDEITNGDDKEAILSNAPEKKDGTFVVPKTVK